MTDPPSGDFVVPGEGAARDALGYMHGNCGFCHNERLEQLAKRSMMLRLSTREPTLAETGAYRTAIRAKMHHILAGGIDQAIVPGEPDKSQLYVRMTADGSLRMPPKGTKVEVVAHFDNSPANKYNPDPTKDVKWGDQTWEEMMIGFWGSIVDRPAPTQKEQR